VLTYLLLSLQLHQSFLLTLTGFFIETQSLFFTMLPLQFKLLLLCALTFQPFCIECCTNNQSVTALCTGLNYLSQPVHFSAWVCE